MARARTRVDIDAAAIERLGQGEDVKRILRTAAEAGTGAARSGAPNEENFASSFSIREGESGSGRNGYIYARVWNDSPIANLIEFGAPKRRGPRRNGNYLGKGFNAAVNRLGGG